MNRRDALALLASLPATATLTRATVRPTSVIVLECDLAMSAETHARLVAALRQVWAEPQRILVLSEGMHLHVLDEVP